MKMLRPPFDADQPITQAKQDSLKREPFAASLAATLATWKNEESLVVGIYGEWGSGKTSIKNLIIERLNGSGQPRIIDFNPWQWASQDQVLQAFFAEIGSALGLVNESNEITITWNHLRSILLDAGSSLLSSPEIFAAHSDTSWFQRCFLKLAGILWKKARDLQKTTMPRDAAETKSHLRKLFLDLKEPVIVFIDDIDRLSNPEIEQLVQLIKINADFPNMVYLLLCDRKRVEEALEVGHSKHGADFLEKIVQVNFNIPEIERPTLEKILLDGVEGLWRGSELTKTWDSVRWMRLFNKGICPYFRNLREVKRFLSALNFYFGLFRSADSYEIDVIDLVGLQVLREFETEVYAGLIHKKEALTGFAGPSNIFPSSADERRHSLETLLKSAKQRDLARKILDLMFPAFTPVLNGVTDVEQDDVSPAPRISNPQTFERYFYFRTAEGDVSEAELTGFLRAPKYLRTGAELLRSLNQEGRLDALIRRLNALAPSGFPDVEAVVNSFFDVGDEMPKKKGGSSHFSVFHDAVYLTDRLVTGQAVEHDAFGLLINALNAGASLGFSGAVLEESFNAKTQDKAILTEQNIKSLKSSWVRKTREASKSENLVRNLQLADILEKWSNWDNDIEPRRWLELQIEGPSVLDVIRSFSVNDQVIEGGRVASAAARVDIVRLAKFVDPNSVNNFVAGLLNKNPSQEQRTICELYQESYYSYMSGLSKREKGKPAAQS